MHLLIIILQQLLGMLPSGKSEKAPQTEVVRPQGQAPRGCDSARLSLPIRQAVDDRLLDDRLLDNSLDHESGP
jgi:hypothetical protein